MRGLRGARCLPRRHGPEPDLDVREIREIRAHSGSQLLSERRLAFEICRAPVARNVSRSPCPAFVNSRVFGAVGRDDERADVAAGLAAGETRGSGGRAGQSCSCSPVGILAETNVGWCIACGVVRCGRPFVAEAACRLIGLLVATRSRCGTGGWRSWRRRSRGRRTRRAIATPSGRQGRLPARRGRRRR